MDKMKKHKKPAIFAGSSLIVSVMVICLCFCGFSSPKNQYFALEKKNIQALVSELEEFSKSDFGKFFVLDPTKALEVGAEISMDFDTGEENEMPNMLKNSKIVLIEQQDLINDYDSLKLKYVIDNDEFLDINMVLDKNIFGIEVKEIVDKYLVIDTQKLDDLYKKIGYDAEDMPSKVVTVKELFEKIDLSDEELKILKTEFNEYLKIITSNFNENDVIIKNDVEVEIKGEKIKCNVMEVKITQKYVREVAIELIEAILEGKSLDILTEKYEKLINLYENAGYVSEIDESIFKMEMIKALQTALEELKAINEEPYESKNIIMNVYYNNKDEIIQREIYLENDDSDKIIFTSYVDNDRKCYAYETIDKKMAYEIDIMQNQEIHKLYSKDIEVMKAVVDKSQKDKTNVKITANGMEGFLVDSYFYKEGNKTKLDMLFKMEDMEQKIKINTLLYVLENPKFEKINLANEEKIDIVKLSDSKLQKELENIELNYQKWCENHYDVLLKLMDKMYYDKMDEIENINNHNLYYGDNEYYDYDIYYNY